MGLAISLILTSCAKHNKDDKAHNDLGSGDKSNLPVTLESLIEHAEYCKAIYDSGGDQKDEVAFEVKQDNGIYKSCKIDSQTDFMNFFIRTDYHWSHNTKHNNSTYYFQ